MEPRVGGDGYREAARDYDGSVWERYYFGSKELSRSDGPALIHRSSEGALISEEWWRTGKRHRFGGPAKTEYRADGSAVVEEWWAHGTFHRIDGPAVVDTGHEPRTEFYFDGGWAEDHDDLVELLHLLNETHLAEELGRSSYGPLLDEGMTPERVLEFLDAGVRTVGGIREVLSGAPMEWVRSFEEGQS